MRVFETKYDELFSTKVAKFFPELLEVFGPKGWLWVKAQCWQESRFNPLAVSPAGAKGLMQLMPGTDKAIDGDIDGFDPEGNIENGVKYLAEQYRKLSEIPCETDRLCAAFASYNGGRGYLNKAMALGRKNEGLPFGYFGWASLGKEPGLWQTWPVIAELLSTADCDHNNLHPDHAQMTDYVDKINFYFVKLALQAEVL